MSAQPSRSGRRCPWCPPDDALYLAYHDKEWGVPVRNDRRLFEMLNLEGAQAGLSWRTILGRRAGYRRVFARFAPRRLAEWRPRDIQSALQDPGIIRNRLKVAGVVRNAQAYLDSFGSRPGDFTAFIWSFVDGRPVQNAFERMDQVPARTEISDQLSRELKKRGFTFVGSTICYAFMQAVGMVNDHLISCPRHREVRRLEAPGVR